MVKKLKALTATQIVRALKDRKGQHVLVSWERPLKTLGEVSMDIRKRTVAYVRAGINYANLAAVKAGIEAGTRDEVQGLQWGEWEQFPFIIKHTPRGTSKVIRYVRLYPAVFGNLQNEMVTSYTIDGVAATAEQVKPYCLASEFRKSAMDKLMEETTTPTPEQIQEARNKDRVDCFTLKAENILSIGD